MMKSRAGGRRAREADAGERKTGYYLDVFHQTPAGEDRHTAVLWTDGIPTRKKLAKWAEDYRRVLRERKYVLEELGYLPDPTRIAARLRGRDRIVTSWRSRE